MGYNEAFIAVRPLSKDAVLQLLPPMLEVEGPTANNAEMSIDLAEWEDGIILRGELVRLFGEGVAQEASRNGKSTCVIWDTGNASYLLSRFERGLQSDRVEVSGYDIIEDSMGIAEPGRNVADWHDMNLDGELEWALGQFPYHNLGWVHLTIQNA